MKNIPFSVLISVYHKEEGEFLRLSLDSVMTQPLMPNEVVLIKDGPLTSELDAVCDEFICRYPDIIKIVVLPENVGLGKALNEGLKHCSYDLVARMDSDDICKSNRFELQTRKFEENPDLDVVSSWIDEFENDPIHIKRTKKLPENHFSIFKYAKQRCPINHPAVMFKKKEVLLAGGYQSMFLYEDYYLWARMLMNGSKFYNIQESLLLFRCSSETFARRGGLKYALTELKFFQKLNQVGFISSIEFAKIMFIRFISRIIPNKLRAALYTNFLRK